MFSLKRGGLFLLLVFLYLDAAAQKKKYTFITKDYIETSKEREAAYKLFKNQIGDTLFFSVYNISPKGLIEKGQFPVNQGFDIRNCQISRFWPNGKVRAKGEIKNGWNKGLWTYYSEKGQLYSTVEYKNGLINGTATRFYPNGYTRSYSYISNIKNGESTYANENKRVIEICTYVNDSLDGYFLEFFTTGIIKRKTLFKRQLKVTDSLFWENGKLLSSEMYDDQGILHGRCNMYTAFGKLARYDDYNHGEVTQSNCIHPLTTDEYYDDCPTRYLKPTYPGGIEAYQDWCYKNQDFPELAIKWRQFALIEYQATVLPDGNVTNFTQENIIPFGFGLEQEAERLLKKIKKYEPEKLNGRAQTSIIKIPFYFVEKEQQQ